MIIKEVRVYRDGGTITIFIEDDPEAGAYTLPTPFHDEPRSIHYHRPWDDDSHYKNSETFGIGSTEEAEFLAKLRDWWERNITVKIHEDLHYLNGLSEWRNLPARLDEAISFFRVRIVIDYLEKRHSDTN